MLRILFFLCCLTSLAKPAWAQHEYDNWCFGYDTIPGPSTQLNFYTRFGRGAQINFGLTKPQTIGFCRAANNSISDAQGNLLFYTNGDNIYDRRHQLMPGGASLADATDIYCVGNPAGAGPNNVLLPAPGQPGVYYIFSFRRDPASTRPYISDNLHLVYCLVDMRANGGFGTVTQRDVVVISALPNNTMHLLVVRHRNGRDFWLLTRNLKNRTFSAYLLSPAGLAIAPVISSSTADTPYPLGVFLNFRISPDGQELFAPGTIAGTDNNGKSIAKAVYALYHFDNATGLVNDERIIYTELLSSLPSSSFDLGSSTCNGFGTNCIAACFSPSSRVLYTIETILPASDFRNSICQYDLTQPTIAAIQASRLVLEEAPTQFLLDQSALNRFADLQLAPDGTIWVGDLIHRNLQRSPTALIDVQPKAVSIIRHPDVVGVGCQLDLLAYPLPGRVGASQFPNIVTNMLYAPTALEAQVSCTDSTRFWPNSAQSGPPGRWNFGDPGSGLANEATGYYVAHRYTRGGTYQVMLTYPNGRTLSRALTVPAGQTDLAQLNIFTPNSDGQNDTFQMVAHGTLTDDATLRIYSRWGQLMHEIKSAAPSWDGAGAAAGTYFYQLDYADCQGQLQHQRGWVELVK